MFDLLLQLIDWLEYMVNNFILGDVKECRKTQRNELALWKYFRSITRPFVYVNFGCFYSLWFLTETLPVGGIIFTRISTVGTKNSARDYGGKKETWRPAKEWTRNWIGCRPNSTRPNGATRPPWRKCCSFWRMWRANCKRPLKQLKVGSVQ